MSTTRSFSLVLFDALHSVNATSRANNRDSKSADPKLDQLSSLKNSEAKVQQSPYQPLDSTGDLKFRSTGIRNFHDI